jgi:hypothetical protein
MRSRLQHDDPALWLKLQKFPEFQPLTRSLGPSKAGGNLLALGVGIGKGDYLGSFDKWGESTLKDLMKRDGYYTDVLGSKATTLPSPPKSTYSNSKLGQYTAREAPKLESASKASAKVLEAGRAELRTGAATAFGRVGGSVIDIEMQMLNPEVGQQGAVIASKLRMENLAGKGILDEERHAEAQNLLSQGKYVELKKLMDGAMTKYLSGQP